MVASRSLCVVNNMYWYPLCVSTITRGLPRLLGESSPLASTSKPNLGQFGFNLDWLVEIGQNSYGLLIGWPLVLILVFRECSIGKMIFCICNPDQAKWFWADGFCSFGFILGQTWMPNLSAASVCGGLRNLGWKWALERTQLVVLIFDTKWLYCIWIGIPLFPLEQ